MAAHEEVVRPHGKSKLDKGRGRGPLSFSLSLSFPLSPFEKGKGGLILVGVQVGLPPLARPS